jgi:recombination protein U
MYSRSYQNRVNNDLGDIFEKLIDQGCWHYRNKGIAMIEKTPEPFKVKKINSDGSMIVYPIGKAQPDYKGTLQNGQAIVFEAKMTTTDRLKKSVISQNQAACLDSHEALGAKTGICCMIKKTVGFIPWTDWKSMKEKYGRQYLLENELREYQVPTPGYIDFLNKSEW